MKIAQSLNFLLLFIRIIYIMYYLSVNNIMQKKNNPMNRSTDSEAFIISFIIIISNNISNL